VVTNTPTNTPTPTSTFTPTMTDTPSATPTPTRTPYGPTPTNSAGCVGYDQTCTSTDQCCDGKTCQYTYAAQVNKSCIDCRSFSRSCKYDSDCCTGLACTGSGNFKYCQWPESLPAECDSETHTCSDPTRVCSFDYFPPTYGFYSGYCYADKILYGAGICTQDSDCYDYPRWGCDQATKACSVQHW